jgi:UDP-glucose 4-epimerase
MVAGTALITGGAGYVGSHTLLRLAERGWRLIVLDDLSTGRADAVVEGELILGDVGDVALVEHLLRKHHVDVVMHFAARTVVPESVAFPLDYYDVNTSRTRNLLDCCVRCGVDKFVFSSTAAVYGMPPSGVAEETDPLLPINPYGSSKLMCETMLSDLSSIGAMRFVALRYFNVAGADEDGRIGQSKIGCTLLPKVACEAAVGKREEVIVYGTDYDTPDGTGVRDYIHVDDIARAHVSALDYLLDGGESVTLNCGYGHGYSVLEVLSALEHVHGRPIRKRFEPRRPGDPPTLVAVARKIHQVLDWKPVHDDLESILRSGLNWEYQLLERELPATRVQVPHPKAIGTEIPVQRL